MGNKGYILIIGVFCVLWTLISFVQSGKKHLDFVIIIDGEVAIGSIANLSIELNINGNEKIIEPLYYPGNITMKESEYNQALSDSVTVVKIKFDYYKYIGKKQKLYNYEIEFQQEWLKEAFVVLKIYNLDKKEYRDKFEPLSAEKNYTFELDSPTNTFRRIPKKNN